jgi:hypothetical protein
MHAAVGLLRAGFEQVVKLFVVPKKFANREHWSVDYNILPLITRKVIIEELVMRLALVK